VTLGSARLFRVILNLWPCIRGTGVRVDRISADFREIDVRLPLNWRTRNRVGTIFGGSIYASIDPLYMLMLMEILGHDFIVWDKGASIRFRRPGTRTLYAKLRVPVDLTEEVKRKVLADGEWSFDLPVRYLDKNGVEHAEIQKTLYVATKDFYREKVAKRDGATKSG
jgi:hypothetical protein